MEKSHYQCKMGFFKHTQHAGGINRHSPIIQGFEWWYRVIQHREIEIENKKFHDGVDNAAAALKEARRQTYLSSNAREKHAAWRASRRRENSRWVPQVAVIDESSGEAVDPVPGLDDSGSQ